ncbi:cell wall-binding repeat-containing protein [Clostridium sp. C2-6-12]|uniref:cell wall-binding repeat-containing protein n=1 Tax=Clostridium sp. C2-6-12 TaxID=2698832 RepID=UPI001371CAA8|nr:cell wall-binding repeat-containing protein [Clostridium sp. C2-6-12]
MNSMLESCPFTLNTTRICGDDSIDISIEISKIGFSNMKPNTVILVNKQEIFDAIAATSLVHFPFNAPILFTDCNNLRKETLKEIKRLSPKGHNGTQIILVGNFSESVSCELKKHGFKTQDIEGSNYYETACIISRVRKDFKNILIISGEDYSEGIAAGYWSAHHGDPILYTKKNSIPCCTLEAIKKMKDINIYIIGSTKTVSKEVEKYLSKLDNVKRLDRIDGENPYDIAVNFAKYKDPKTDFGWGRHYKEGHAFTFGEVNNPMEIIAGVLFAHMGKHTPLLLTKKDKIPSVVKKYIKLIKPMIPMDMPMPPFMHGFILGSIKTINYNAQIMIEDTLSVDHEMMGMEEHNNHDSHCMHMKHIEMEHEHDLDHMHNMCCEKHIIDMEHDDHDSDCMHQNMCHEGHMIEMKHDDEHDLDHMNHMCQQGHMMEMEHDNEYDLDYMHHMYNNEDENNNEMIDKSNHKVGKNYKSEELNTSYKRVGIDEILG